MDTPVSTLVPEWPKDRACQMGPFGELVLSIDSFYSSTYLPVYLHALICLHISYVCRICVFISVLHVVSLDCFLCLFVCLCSYLPIDLHSCIHTHTHIHMYIYIHTYLSLSIYIYILYLFVYTCVCLKHEET